MYRVTQLWVSTLINKQPDCSRSSGALCDHLATFASCAPAAAAISVRFPIIQAGSRQQAGDMSHAACV